MNQNNLVIVSVAFPIAIPGIYDYLVPTEFSDKIKIGLPVLVPLKSRQVWGVVVVCKSESAFPNLKKVILIKDQGWSDADQSLIKLYEWMAAYYQCDIGKVFKPFVRKTVVESRAKKVTTYKALPLTDQNLSPKQAAAYAICSTFTHGVTTAELVNRGVPLHIISALYKNKALEKHEDKVTRIPVEMQSKSNHDDIVLAPEQREVISTLMENIDNPGTPFLLYGITGSGKTHVYIELAKTALARGKGVIILVPEISLTPQTIQRFHDAIGDDIAVIHSRMSDGERRDSLQDLVSGKKRIVIGVRSAILAPVDHLGLIVIDEEHDQSYKQSDPEPRYQARDVAVMRGKYQQALVVLGSATPSFESYFNALNGKYRYVQLTSRYAGATLPAVSVVDMNQEHAEKNWTFLSRLLHNRITENLQNNRQIIILLNRRGFSTFLICKKCSHIYACRSCSVNLTYHKSDRSLRCHQCGYTETAPTQCAQCMGEQIQYKGTGIQKAEEYLREQFPFARIMRMDQDSTRRKGAHVAILEDFADKKADILIGTQMVAKGLNFPGVALVGVLQADIGLHVPDFRASERTFQLLSQVAGRAGRNDNAGEVVVQTYFPKEPCIVAAGNHDFIGFYGNEIEKRKELGYPPFGKLARIILQGAAEMLVEQKLHQIAGTIVATARGAITVLGPCPAVLSRIENVYRFSLIVKCTSPQMLRQTLDRVRENTRALPRSMRLIIDVDPVNML